MSMPVVHRRRGFTLIELLVVIAIIAILASILFPVFARAREAARQSSCVSNMKQLTTGLLMYLNDYDEQFPGGSQGVNPPPGYGHWVPSVFVSVNNPCLVENGALYPYVKNAKVYTCPSDADAPRTRLSYSQNWNCSFAYLAACQEPAATVLFLDEGKSPNESSSLNDGFFAITNPNDRPSTIHNEGANISFIDGHAKWYKRSQLPALRWSF